MAKFNEKNAGNWIFNVQFRKKFDEFSLDFWNWSGAMVGRSCRSREMLKNAPTLAIVAVHTEENEPITIWCDLLNLIQFGP